jgi:DNA polymerase-3 subunit chi
MTDVRFYHLERQKLDDVLPALLEQALADGAKVVVEGSSSELIETLDERLWTYSDDSFLPHGLVRDGEPETQPILLTTGAENPNGATWRVLVGGARAALSLSAGPHALERVILVFDGADSEARAAARAQWAEMKAAGHAPTYWRQGDTGRWEQAR